jgi:hypothetical protein
MTSDLQTPQYQQHINTQSYNEHAPEVYRSPATPVTNTWRTTTDILPKPATTTETPTIITTRHKPIHPGHARFPRYN